MLTEVPFLKAKVVSPYEYRQISDIKVGFMPRSLDTAYVNELYEILSDGGKFYDNIAIFEDGELIDGLHRLETYKKTSILTVLVQVWQCPKENRTALKIFPNSHHGKQLSKEEKKENYFKMLKDNPEIDDESAGKVCSVSARTIRRWKPESLKQKRLSQEEVQKIREMKEEGKSSREIANEIGVSHTAINKLETSDTCPKLPDSPEPSNVVKAPVEFKKPPVQNEVPDDYDEEDEEDFDDLSIKAEDPGKIVVNPINWKDKGNKFVEAMITASAFSKAIEIDSHGGFPDNMKEVFSEAILLMKKNLPQFIEYFVTTNSLERR